MKRTLGLAMGSVLALMVAGCSSGSSTTTSSGDSSGQPASGSLAAKVEPVRFNLAVRCPGVHYLISKKKSKEEVEGQLNVTDDQIDECEKYVASQPKGFVPPPPAGYVPPAASTASSAKPAQPAQAAQANPAGGQAAQKPATNTTQKN